MNCSQHTSNIWGNNSYFSTYQAVLDLKYVNDLFNNNFNAYNKDNTILYGINYGTYFINQL